MKIGDKIKDDVGETNTITKIDGTRITVEDETGCFWETEEHNISVSSDGDLVVSQSDLY
jgi:hypothetical protein